MLRPELEPPPPRIARLPVHRGYPVPWFVEWVTRDDDEIAPMPQGQGEPDFRIMSRERFGAAIRSGLCWVCGGKLGSHKTFNIGPMCAVNRTSAEPPSHRECAEWSARNCPFLTRPHMRRREAGLPQEVDEGAGVMLKRNPGVALVWVTRKHKLKPDHNGGILFDIGEPDSVSWWCEGRPATREEVQASIDSGLPTLAGMAHDEGPAAEHALERCVDRAMVLVPA
jgi:hypothetical protein